MDLLQTNPAVLPLILFQIPNLAVGRDCTGITHLTFSLFLNSLCKAMDSYYHATVPVNQHMTFYLVMPKGGG